MFKINISRYSTSFVLVSSVLNFLSLENVSEIKIHPIYPFLCRTTPRFFYIQPTGEYYLIFYYPHTDPFYSFILQVCIDGFYNGFSE